MIFLGISSKENNGHFYEVKMWNDVNVVKIFRKQIF